MEPWVNLPTESSFLHWSDEDKIAENQHLRQSEKLKAISFVFDMLNENKILGDYFEFGSHRVRTFRMALSEARKRQMEHMHFYAFDSFEGLPESGTKESEHPLWVKGALSTSLEDFWRIVKSHGIFIEHIHAVKGFYSDSLTDELVELMRTNRRSAAFINIDCDLYESARDALAFCKHFLQEGTVIYIDDLFAGYRSNTFKGVGKALAEFELDIMSRNWHLVPHMQVGWWGRTFIVSIRE